MVLLPINHAAKLWRHLLYCSRGLYIGLYYLFRGIYICKYYAFGEKGSWEKVKRGRVKNEKGEEEKEKIISTTG